MSDQEVHIGDLGTIVKVIIKEENVPLPLTEAEEIKIRFERKDRTTFEVDAAIYSGDPALGIVYCLSDIVFFTMKGVMKVQVWIKYPTGEWSTEVGSFTVRENIVIVEA